MVMADGRLVLCPRCGATLSGGEATWACAACSATFAAVLGIPDLRTADPPYATREQDLERARQIAERFDALDLAGLMGFAYGTLHPELLAADLEAFVAHRLQRAGLNVERWSRLRGLFAAVGREPQSGIAVDLGCGVGGLVPVLATEMPHVIGVDIAMEELVLARKYLEEQKVDNATLVCADAETLPLAPGRISLVNATNVIEHVRDQGQVIARVFELLLPGGVFAFDSPNRWDLVGPEPHVGVRFVGLWPRALQEPYVRLVSGKEYKGKCLLSLTELDRLLHRQIPSLTYRIFYWPRWQPCLGGRTVIGRLLVGRYPRLVAWMNRAWALFVGVHEVVLWRVAGDAEDVGPRVIPMRVSTAG